MTSPKKRFPAYSRLLTLYPPAYRAVYQEQMLQTLTDMLDSAPTRSARTAIWIRVGVDFILSLGAQQLQYIGGIMQNEMPRYIKRTALLSGVLLLPFFIAVFANMIDQLVNHQSLYQSWVWSTPIITLWVLWLPRLALAIAGAGLLVYLWQRIHSAHRSWLQALTEVQYSWPLLAVVMLSLGIFVFLYGHDSAHCIVGNPIHTFEHAKQALTCIQEGS